MSFIFSRRVYSRLATKIPVEGDIYSIDIAINMDPTTGKSGIRGLGTVADDGKKSVDLGEAQNLLGRVAQGLHDGATISKQAEGLVSRLVKRS